MTDLESSLTSMDWLPKLNVRAMSSGKEEKDGKKTNGTTNGNTDDSKSGKPPYSYANLITLAINSCEKKKMTLSEIYSWICSNYPYYEKQGNGWKNSIRHNLSLNKCFMKVARSKDDPGKGSYWAIDTNPVDDSFVSKKRKPNPEMIYCGDLNVSNDSIHHRITPNPTFSVHSPDHSTHSPVRMNPAGYNYHNNNGNQENSNNDMSFENVPLHDLSASFKSLYRNVFQQCNSDLQQSSSSSMASHHSSYNGYSNSNSTHLTSSTHSTNSMNPGNMHMCTPPPLSHIHATNQISAPPNSHNATLNEINKANTSSNSFDLNNNIESLKNSCKIAQEYNFSSVDFNQYSDLIESMHRAERNGWDLDPQKIIDLCSSLNQFFQQTGVVDPPNDMTSSQMSNTSHQSDGLHNSRQQPGMQGNGSHRSQNVRGLMPPPQSSGYSHPQQPNQCQHQQNQVDDIEEDTFDWDSIC